MPSKIVVCEDLENWSMNVAQWLVDQMRELLSDRERIRLVVPGGNTPRGLFAAISSRFGNAIDWSRVDLLQSDERWVQPTDDQSNQRMIREAFGSIVRDGGAVFYAMNTLSADPGAGAQEYQDLLDRFVRNSDGHLVDFVLLGMGDDGHVASLFPGDLQSLQSDQWCVATWVEKLRSHRITLTPKALHSSRTCTFLVTGQSKNPALAKVWHDECSPMECPAAVMKRHPSIFWCVDQAALGDTEIPSDWEMHHPG